MRRHLPVFQPNVIERRAFLLGIMGAIAACSDEASGPTRTGSSSGTSSGSSGKPKDGGASGSSGDDGGSSSGDGGGSSSGSSGFDSGTSSGVDSGPKGCLAAGKEVGPPASFAMGTVTYVAALNAFVGRDAGGLYAMYALCTHAVGNLNVNGGQLVCTVHGARFTLTGDFVSGPGGTFALPHFDICLNSKGNVAVDPNTIAPTAFRLNA